LRAKQIQFIPLSYFLKIHFIVILPNTLRCSKYFLSLSFPSKNHACTLSLTHSCHIFCPSNSSRFDHPNNIWRGVQITKLLVVQSSAPCYSSLSPPNIPLITLFSNTIKCVPTCDNCQIGLLMAVTIKVSISICTMYSLAQI